MKATVKKPKGFISNNPSPWGKPKSGSTGNQTERKTLTSDDSHCLQFAIKLRFEQRSVHPSLIVYSRPHFLIIKNIYDWNTFPDLSQRWSYQPWCDDKTFPLGIPSHYHFCLWGGCVDTFFEDGVNRTDLCWKPGTWKTRETKGRGKLIKEGNERNLF